MTLATQNPHLGALLRAGAVLASARPLPDRLREVLADVTPALGATGAVVRRHTSDLASWGARSRVRPALVVPLRAGDVLLGELAVWRRGPANMEDEQAWHVLADTVTLAVQAAHEAARAAVLAADEERAALAYELHDGLLQSLVAARMTVEFAGGDGTPVRAASAQARATVWSLRPRTPDGRLMPALLELAERLRAAVEVRVTSPGLPDSLPDLQARLAFRCAQAAVAACAAAGARVVHIRVTACRGGAVRVAVSHDAPVEPDTAPLARWLARLERAGGHAARAEHAWLTVDVPGTVGEGERL